MCGDGNPRAIVCITIRPVSGATVVGHVNGPLRNTRESHSGLTSEGAGVSAPIRTELDQR